MLTIKAEVQRDKQRNDGSYNVKIRFTYERKVRRLSSSLFVTAKDLTKSLSFKDGTPIKREIAAKTETKMRFEKTRDFKRKQEKTRDSKN